MQKQANGVREMENIIKQFALRCAKRNRHQELRMLIERPIWQFSSKRRLWDSYDHVHLCQSHVVGNWFALDRESGKRKWQRIYFRPNNIRHIDDAGIIVADEMRSDGPGLGNYGCYGICLETGKLLWTSHRSGIWRVVLRALDFLPCFANDIRDVVEHVSSGQIYCCSGRVLDVKTGRVVKRLSKQEREEVRRYKLPISTAWKLNEISMKVENSPVTVAQNLSLSHVANVRKRNKFALHALDTLGNEIWRFDQNDLGGHVGGYRLVGQYIYVVSSEESPFKPHPTLEHFVLANATLWHLKTLDIRTGEIAQSFPLSQDLEEVCRIEDVDERGVLISLSSRKLLYFSIRNQSSHDAAARLDQ